MSAIPSSINLKYGGSEDDDRWSPLQVESAEADIEHDWEDEEAGAEDHTNDSMSGLEETRQSLQTLSEGKSDFFTSKQSEVSDAIKRWESDATRNEEFMEDNNLEVKVKLNEIDQFDVHLKDFLSRVASEARSNCSEGEQCEESKAINDKKSHAIPGDGAMEDDSLDVKDRLVRIDSSELQLQGFTPETLLPSEPLSNSYKVGEQDEKSEVINEKKSDATPGDGAMEDDSLDVKDTLSRIDRLKLQLQASMATSLLASDSYKDEQDEKSDAIDDSKSDASLSDEAMDLDMNDGLGEIDASDLELQDFIDLEAQDVESVAARSLEDSSSVQFYNPLRLNPPSGQSYLDSSLDGPSTPSSPTSSSSYCTGYSRYLPIEINGVEVFLTEVGVTESEARLYGDERLGRFRCIAPSPLRRCWMPI